MACRTSRWGWPVEEDLHPFNLTKSLVAHSAGHVLVSTFEGELRFLVIEQGWPPLHGSMALCTTRYVIRADELRRMGIFVAVLTFLGG